jgi:membrane-bound metal-dependent hydrolase YbcI (DUF457 family)
MIIGHLALAGIAKRRFMTENFIFLVIASYGPDLIDKTASMISSLPSRGFGHSLLCFIIVAGVAWFFCQKFRISKVVFYTCVVLWLSHLATDLVEPEILFWPLLGPLPLSQPWTLAEKLSNFYIYHLDLAQFIIDITSILIASVLWLYYLWEKKYKVLSEKSQLPAKP